MFSFSPFVAILPSCFVCPFLRPDLFHTCLFLIQLISIFDLEQLQHDICNLYVRLKVMKCVIEWIKIVWQANNKIYYIDFYTYKWWSDTHTHSRRKREWEGFIWIVYVIVILGRNRNISANVSELSLSNCSFVLLLHMELCVFEFEFARSLPHFMIDYLASGERRICTVCVRSDRELREEEIKDKHKSRTKTQWNRKRTHTHKFKHLKMLETSSTKKQQQ